jgi:hypothetical protein
MGEIIADCRLPDTLSLSLLFEASFKEFELCTDETFGNRQ